MWTLVSLALLAIAHVTASPLSSRLVVSPPLTFPNASTVWYTGQKNVTATWSVPSYASGYKGMLVLGWLNESDSSGNEHLMFPPLAKGFNLTDGQVTFDIPCNASIMTRSSYILVLFGDSGNKGSTFTIQRNETACANCTTT